MTKSVYILLILGFVFFLAACEKDPITEGTENKNLDYENDADVDDTDLDDVYLYPEMIEMESDALSLYTGDAHEIRFIEDYTPHIISVLSYDEDFVSINNYTLEALKDGETTITFHIENTDLIATLFLTILRQPDILIQGFSDLYVGQTLTYTAVDEYHKPLADVMWQTSDETIATIDDNSRLVAVDDGLVDIIATRSDLNLTVRRTIKVLRPPVEDFYFSIKESQFLTDNIYTVDIVVSPHTAKPDIVWESSNEMIAYINDDSLLITLNPGRVQLTGRIESNAQMTHQITLDVVEPVDPMDALLSHMQENLIDQTITVFGFQGMYKFRLISNPFFMLFDDLTIIEQHIPIEHANRQGSITVPRYIVIHDTGNIAWTADEFAHSSYVRNPSTTVSWHYSVGEFSVIQHIPDNEHAFHTGDGGRQYSLYDTMIHVDGETLPQVTIDSEGYYRLDGTQSVIKAPMAGSRLATTHDIVDSGIRVVHGDNDNWWIGSTYWGYSVVANTGGDSGGIGIEKMINRGSDLYLTWSHTAKLTAYLIQQYHLSINDVVQHDFFSGKNCPQTMRQADMWQHFISMVEAELLLLSLMEDYTISFTSHNPEYINNKGRIIKLPNEATTVLYTITIENETYYRSETLEIDLPAK